MEVMQDIASAAEATEMVICRPAGEMRAAAWLGIALGAATLVGSASLPFLIPGSIWLGLAAGCFGCSFFTLPFGIWMAAYLYKAIIVADAAGLRWREAGRWRIVAWSDVNACYDTWERKSKSSSCFKLSKVKTRRGTLTLSPGKWTNERQLRAYIEQQTSERFGSKAAQNTTQSAEPIWKVQGGLLNCLPLRCHYATTVNRNILEWMDSLHKYGLLAVAGYFAFQWLTLHMLPGWGWLLTPTGLFVIGKQILPLLLRPTYRATQPRLNDKVLADKEGLRFIDPGGETAVCWEDITGFYSLGIRSVIVTPSGEYDFLETLTNVEQLKLIIPILATNANQAAWRTGTVRRRQVSQSDGRQSAYCAYHYRTQDNCGRLWGLTLAVLFVAGMTLGPAFTAWQSGSRITVPESAVACLGITGLLALFWLWGSYWRGGIRTDESGITQTTLLGQKQMAWSQMHVFRWRGNSDLTWGCVDGRHGTIRFWKGIGDADRLADEIAARADTTS